MASARPLAVACLCLKKDRTAAGCAFRSSLSPVAVGVAWRGHGGRYGPIYGWRAFPVRRHAKIFRRAARFGAESGMVARRRPSKWRTWEPAAGTRQACRPPCRRPRRAAAQRPPWRHGRLSSPDAGPRAADCSTAFAGLRCPLAPDGPPSMGSHAAAAGFCALSPPHLRVVSGARDRRAGPGPPPPCRQKPFRNRDSCSTTRRLGHIVLRPLARGQDVLQRGRNVRVRQGRRGFPDVRQNDAGNQKSARRVRGREARRRVRARRKVGARQVQSPSVREESEDREDGTREEAVLPFFSNMPRRRLARCRPR